VEELTPQANALWASELESCATPGHKVVINKTFVDVVCTIEGLLMRGMIVARHFQHSTTESPLHAAVCQWRLQRFSSQRYFENSRLHSRSL
jgi:hypothetical protein